MDSSQDHASGHVLALNNTTRLIFGPGQLHYLVIIYFNRSTQPSIVVCPGEKTHTRGNKGIGGLEKFVFFTIIVRAIAQQKSTES